MDEMVHLTRNERIWLSFLRIVSKGSDPKPTLRRIRLLRRVFRPRRA